MPPLRFGDCYHNITDPEISCYFQLRHNGIPKKKAGHLGSFVSRLKALHEDNLAEPNQRLQVTVSPRASRQYGNSVNKLIRRRNHWPNRRIEDETEVHGSCKTVYAATVSY